MIFPFNISDCASLNSAPAISVAVKQTQSERMYWKHPVALKKTNHLRVLNSVPIAEANLQNIDEALDGLVADIGPALKQICNKMKGIIVWPLLHVRY